MLGGVEGGVQYMCPVSVCTTTVLYMTHSTEPT